MFRFVGVYHTTRCCFRNTAVQTSFVRSCRLHLFWAPSRPSKQVAAYTGYLFIFAGAVLCLFGAAARTNKNVGGFCLSTVLVRVFFFFVFFFLS